MTIRILGAVLILVGCSTFGFLLSATSKRETATLKSFIESMDIMECELRYRRPPLPQLCGYLAASQSGIIQTYFSYLQSELLQQIQPSASACADLALNRMSQMPKHTKVIIQQFAKFLGEFDIDGQLTGIQAVRNEAVLQLKQLSRDQDLRIKNYRTLGVCAGAAIIILFI